MDKERLGFERQLLSIIPDLRAFARFLVGDPAEADDLVQDTIVRALRSYRLFDLNTNIKAWAFTILRNVRKNAFRKNRITEEFDEEAALAVPVRANQEDNLELKQVLAAIQKLSPAQRGVIALIRARGMTYDETSAIMGCEVGTVKSRLNRADAALRALLGPEFSAVQARRSGTHRSVILKLELPETGCRTRPTSVPLGALAHPN